MARTAPVPNIPPIPGMNPCVFVKGGGGAGGGGSGKGGKGKGGAQGADGENGGEDAEGGGNGSGACGQGANGACTNCGSQIARGDPVDVISGKVFTVPKTDLYLPGTFHLDVRRSYSSARKDTDVGMGFGWVHGLAWTLEVGRRHTILRTGDGRRVDLPRLKRAGREVRLGSWGLMRGETFYLVRPANEFMHYFAPVERGSRHYRLRFIRYRDRGHVSLQYEGRRLARVVDTVGRVILFGGGSDGRITSITVPDPHGGSIVFARYAYDSAGNLVAASDADGAMTRYAYDDDHRLTRLEYPSGLVFHYVYDRAGRCIETWGDHPDGRIDPALAEDLPPTLRDGRTRAKGIYHCIFDRSEDGYIEAIDSVQIQRFEEGPDGTVAKAVDGRGGVTQRTYDELNRVTSVSDPTGATWVYGYDAYDELVHETDPDGGVFTLKRELGRVMEMVNPAGGAIIFTRTDSGEVQSVHNEAGDAKWFVHDERSLVKEVVDERNQRWLYEYDAHANLVSYTTPKGARHQFSYDYWGRRIKSRDPLGNERHCTYTPSGRVTSMTDRLGRKTSLAYDAMGNVIRAVWADGSSHEWQYGGLNWRYCIRHPDGSEIRTTHNREGWPLALRNERGEVHAFDYGPSGLIDAETDFLGRKIRYGYDALGRLAWFDEGKGKHEIQRTLSGRLLGEVAPDGRALRFEYDARGDLVRAENDEVAFVWRRDPAGRILQEEWFVEGQSYRIDSERDRAGARTAFRTSLGLEVEVRRDAEGRVSELWHEGERAVAFARNPLGLPVERSFARGGAIRDTYDAENRLRRRELLGPSAADSGGPDWVGPRPGTHDILYDYSLVDELVKETPTDSDEVTLEYDVRRHLLKRRRGKEVEELAADGADNIHEGGPYALRRSYGAGSRLLSRGDTRYAYDDLGNLVSKTDGKGAETRYEWDVWGLLRAVEQPDGSRIEFLYDPFARRVAKKKLMGGRVVEEHHFVWDLLTMVHDVELGESPTARTHLYEDNSKNFPIAQRSNGSWIHLVGDVTGAPRHLVDEAGNVVGTMARTALGRFRAEGSVTTPFRMPGQQEDVDTGLHYNRFRYFDPEIGRFISPDPIGLMGGLNHYAFGPNTIAWIDPMGWHYINVTESGVPPGGAPFNAASAHTPSRGPYSTGTWYRSGSEGNPPALQTTGKCHTEQQFAHDLISQFGGQRARGRTYDVTSRDPSNPNCGFPPCPNCHGAMMRAARETGADINYHWNDPDGNPQTITYEGGTGDASTTSPRGQEADRLVGEDGAYSQHRMTARRGANWALDDRPDAGPAEYWGVSKGSAAHPTYDSMMRDRGYRDEPQDA